MLEGRQDMMRENGADRGDAGLAGQVMGSTPRRAAEASPPPRNLSRPGRPASASLHLKAAVARMENCAPHRMIGRMKARSVAGPPGRPGLSVIRGRDGRGEIGRIALDNGGIAHRRLINDGDAGNEAVFDLDVDRNEILETTRPAWAG